MLDAPALLLEALTLSLSLLAPVLGAAALVSLGVGGLLAWVRLDDPVLRAIPRTFAVWLALAALASFGSEALVGFTARTYSGLTELSR